MLTTAVKLAPPAAVKMMKDPETAVKKMKDPETVVKMMKAQETAVESPSPVPVSE